MCVCHEEKRVECDSRSSTMHTRNCSCKSRRHAITLTATFLPLAHSVRGEVFATAPAWTPCPHRAWGWRCRCNTGTKEAVGGHAWVAPNRHVALLRWAVSAPEGRPPSTPVVQQQPLPRPRSRRGQQAAQGEAALERTALPAPRGTCRAPRIATGRAHQGWAHFSPMAALL